VLLDVMMPDLDGYAVLQHLKGEPKLRDIPVLMISALDEMDSVVRWCIQLGADDYLGKPFDAVLLQARIGACLEKKRLHDLDARHRRELAELNQTLERRVAEQVGQLERLGRLNASSRRNSRSASSWAAPTIRSPRTGARSPSCSSTFAARDDGLLQRPGGGSRPRSARDPDGGALTLKGLARPVRIWSVRGLSAVDGGGSALR
jgi:response regulator RpfG family c-di-GMP phosphodiesterase